MARLTFLALLCWSLACTPAASPPDAGQDAGTTQDAGSEDDAGSSNLECSFNDDCPALERCECELESGCFCHLGERGTGKSGIDACSDGNDCETSLCVEGNDEYYCSGPCVDDDDCGPALPVCADIAFVGRICIR